MSQKQKALICETLFLFAFGYILAGYKAAAIFVSLVSLFIVSSDETLHAIKKHYLSFIFFSILYLYLSYIFHIEEDYPGFNVIILLQSCLCSCMAENHVTKLRYIFRTNIYLLGTFICLAFVLLDLYDSFFFQRIIMILLIFCPYFTCLLQKELSSISIEISRKTIKKDR